MKRAHEITKAADSVEQSDFLTTLLAQTNEIIEASIRSKRQGTR